MTTTAVDNTTVAVSDENSTVNMAVAGNTTVDLRQLSQSELYSLSQSSDSFDLNRCNDAVFPKINRSVFNESAGSRKQTYSIHRRTPNLRSSHTTPSNNINDPDQAENSHIIRMLKQLLKSDPNFDDLLSIENENNNNSNSFVVPEFLNPETLMVKRKRGRPRKHENAVFLRPPKRIRNHTVKEVVFDDERDREIVNGRGVRVNVDALAGLEDPYGSEIRRRTVGMLTEDELLGFLRGLNGEWGSRRKKRRVVDASEFGDVLPKGWKLSLSIKKKEGRVWLFCRRYLSPSGRQFESCKEISTYLVSLIGEENLDKPNHANINSRDDFVLKAASINAADPVLKEDIKKDGPVNNPSPPPPAEPFLPTSTNCEKQVTLDIGCHAKIIKKTEPSLTPTVESDYDPELVMRVPSKESPALVLAEHNVIVETYDAHSGDKLKPASPCSNYKIISGTESNTDEPVHDLNIVNGQINLDGNILIEKSCDKSGKNCIIDDDEVPGIDRAPDVAVSPSELLGDEVALPVDESSEKSETETHATCVDNKSEGNLDQGINTGSVPLSPLPNEQMGSASGAGKDEISTSVSVQVLNQDAVSETGVTDYVHDKSESILEPGSSVSCLFSSLPSEQTGSGSGVEKDIIGTPARVEVLNHAVSETGPLKSSIGEEKVFGADMVMHVSSMNDELISEKEKIVDSESSSGFFLSRFGLDKETKLDIFHSFRNNEPKHDESVGSLGSSHDELSRGVLDFDRRKNLEFSSLVRTENEQEFGFQDDVSCLYDKAMEECKQESSERGLLNQFSIAETSDDIFESKMYSTPLDGLKFDEDRDLSSHELSLAFGNQHVLYPDAIRVEQKKEIVNCSVVPSKIEEAFDVHTNLSMVNNSMVEDLKTGRNLDGLFSLSRNNETSVFRNDAKTVYPGIASDEFRSSGNKKFMTGFGSNHSQPHEVVPRGMWRTDQGNQLHSGLTNPSHAQIQSPSSFHSFDIMSHKAEDGHFRLDERYNDGFGVGGLRSGRSEPMEFSFLTGRSEHNPNVTQGDSRVFSYNPVMEQQFDSNFWLGRNTMMPNTAVRNQVTSVCAWCRNEFNLHPVNSGTQDGIGSLCPTCSAGISGHVNML